MDIGVERITNVVVAEKSSLLVISPGNMDKE